MLLKQNVPMGTDPHNLVGEGTPSTIQLQPAPLDVIRTETVLSKLPIHNLAKTGKVNIQITKSGPSGQVELKWEVSYSDRYGQARQLAYKLDTIVIDRRIEEVGRPLPDRLCLGSLRDIADQLELGGDTNKVRRALRQNASAFITAKFKYKSNDGTERTLEADFTRYSVIFTGEKFPDGSRADAVYVILNQPYREVLNNAPMRPLDLGYKKQLPPAAQRFYEIVSYKIFAALKYNQPIARLPYSEYCTFSAQQRYFVREQFRKQMFKVHRPHLQSGYLVKVHYQETSDEEGRPDWVMCYEPGPKARAEYATFSGKRPRSANVEVPQEFQVGATLKGTIAQGEKPGGRPGPRQRRLSLRPAPESQPQPRIIDYRLVAELTKRGIGESDARQLIASLPPAQPILDQLEWGDYQIAQQPGKFTNPPGFYISLLHRNVTPSATFETSQAKTARLEAENARQRAFQEQQAAEERAAAEIRQQLDSQLAALPPGQYQALFDQAKAEVFASPIMAGKPYGPIHDGAIRARMRQLIANGWSAPLQNVAEPPHSVTEPLIRNLQTLLTTPQLPAPAEPAPAAMQPDLKVRHSTETDKP